MSEKITYAKVTARIKSAAEEIIETNAPFPKEGSLEAWQEYSEGLEACLNEASDHAWQEVDSWDWSIYTWMGWAVYDILSSDERNDAEQEWSDCGGYDTAKEQEQGPYEIGAAIAFFALVNMLLQEIERQCEDLQELAQDKIWQLERA